jgi:hypothetical protein
LEFSHQSLDLCAASPLTPANRFAFRHHSIAAYMLSPG